MIDPHNTAVRQINQSIDLLKTARTKWINILGSSPGFAPVTIKALLVAGNLYSHVPRIEKP
jgi:hypothetical protein